MSESGATEVDAWFAENLAAARKEAGMSQSALADQMAEAGFSFHQTTIARIESGARPVRIGEAEALSRIFDSTVADMCRAPARAGAQRRLRNAVDLGAEIWEDAKHILDRLHQQRAVVRDALKEAKEAAGGAVDGGLAAQSFVDNATVEELFKHWKAERSSSRQAERTRG